MIMICLLLLRLLVQLHLHLHLHRLHGPKQLRVERDEVGGVDLAPSALEHRVRHHDAVLVAVQIRAVCRCRWLHPRRRNALDEDAQEVLVAVKALGLGRPPGRDEACAGGVLEAERGIFGVDARAAERAAGLGLEPAVDAVEVEGVAAAREEAEQVRVVEARQAHRALQPLPGPAESRESEERQRLDHRLGDAVVRRRRRDDRGGGGGDGGGWMAEFGVHEEKEGEREDHGEDANDDGYAGAERHLDAYAGRLRGGLGGGRLRCCDASSGGEEGGDEGEACRCRHGHRTHRPDSSLQFLLLLFSFSVQTLLPVVYSVCLSVHVVCD